MSEAADGRVPASDVVDQLGIRLSTRGGLPTAGVVIVRTIFPNNEVGIAIGTSPTQSWVDNIGLVRAAEMIIQNDMMLHAINAQASNAEDE